MAIRSHARQPVVLLVALLVLLAPTTIGALLSAIGIAGMDRMVRHNVLAMSGRAVEAAGDVTTLSGTVSCCRTPVISATTSFRDSRC